MTVLDHHNPEDHLYMAEWRMKWEKAFKENEKAFKKK